jgi:hypothetical protein
MSTLRNALALTIAGTLIVAVSCDSPTPPERAGAAEARLARGGVPGPPTADAGEASKIRIGYAIAPVPLDMAGKNPALVGLGSYVVNAQGDCAGCHSLPPMYAPGGDPHLGQPEQINQATYLAGGADFFGPFVPRNLTPDANGQPARLTLEQFLTVLNTGADLKNRPPFVPSVENDLLQVMPWPVFRNMTEREKIAIYEYLSAIPCLGSAARCGS